MAVIAGMTFVLFLLFKWGVSAPCSSSSSSSIGSCHAPGIGHNQRAEKHAAAAAYTVLESQHATRHSMETEDASPMLASASSTPPQQCSVVVQHQKNSSAVQFSLLPLTIPGLCRCTCSCCCCTCCRLLLQCYKLIYGYMGFAMLNILFFFTGALVLQLLRLMGLHMDLFSLPFLLFNFSVRTALSKGVSVV
eukprot:GHRQ01040259.1.p1 GENE.GHRQ01040259.1~~GHRQ01040259.1.p1  ORF type:complete len:192 (+),score=61.31 GHRQ01040259.1:240-815(+)